jgi:hypothetical protein
LETHPLPSIPDTGDIDKVSSQASVGTGERNSKGDRPVSKGGPESRNEPNYPG